jgi:predicted transcriptional regulator
MDAVFHALANGERRRVLDIVKERPGCSVNHVAGFFEISRIAVMKHLRVLERAGLILSEKEGRTRRLFFNGVPIQMIYDRWTSEYSALWASRLTRVKYRIESRRKNDAGNRKGGVQSVHPRADRRRLA